MVAKNTINIIRDSLKPFVNAGMVSDKEVAEALNLIKKGNNKTEEKKDELLTRKQLAERWSMHKCTIYALDRAGKIKSIEFGRRSKRYRLSDVLAYELTRERN